MSDRRPPPETPEDDGAISKGEARLVGERLDLLFEEARSWEYMVLNEADRVQMQVLMSKMAGGGWEVHTFTAIADPAYPKGRKSTKGIDDPDEMSNLPVIYVALMRRGGLLRKV